MLRAAFTSRSCTVPPLSHVHSRTFSELRADRPAGPAQLAAGEPSVDHNEFTPIPGEFERPAQRAFAQALQGQLPHVGAASGVRQAGADRSQLPYPVAFASHRPAPSPGVGRPDDWSADPSVCPSSGDAEAFRELVGADAVRLPDPYAVGADVEDAVVGVDAADAADAGERVGAVRHEF